MMIDGMITIFVLGGIAIAGAIIALPLVYLYNRAHGGEKNFFKFLWNL